MEGRLYHRHQDVAPGRIGHEAGDDVGKIDRAGKEEHLFDDPVIPHDDQVPDGGGTERHRDVAAHTEDLEARRKPRKLCRDVPEVGDQQGQHGVKSDFHAVALADEIGEPLAGHDAKAGHHLLDQDEENEHRDQGPQERIAILGPGHGVRGNSTGVIVDIGRDDPRSDDAEEEQDVRLVYFFHRVCHEPISLSMKKVRRWACHCPLAHVSGRIDCQVN